MLLSLFSPRLWHRFWFSVYFSMHSSSYLHGFGIDFDHLYCLRCSNGSTEDYINIEIYCFYRFRCASHIIKHPIASIRDFPPFPDTLFLPPTIPPPRRQASAASAPHPLPHSQNRPTATPPYLTIRKPRRRLSLWHIALHRDRKARAAGFRCAADQRTGASVAYRAADEET